METIAKVALKKGDKVLIAINTIRATVTNIDSHTFDWTDGKPAGTGGSHYLSAEGHSNGWCRGWTGAAVNAIKKAVRAKAAEERKQKIERERAEAKRERGANYQTIKRLQEAGRIVTAAKLPRELRKTAFEFCLARNYGPYMR
jgi:hypothetical protein